MTRNKSKRSTAIGLLILIASIVIAFIVAKDGNEPDRGVSIVLIGIVMCFLCIIFPGGKRKNKGGGGVVDQDIIEQEYASVAQFHDPLSNVSQEVTQSKSGQQTQSAKQIAEQLKQFRLGVGDQVKTKD